MGQSEEIGVRVHLEKVGMSQSLIGCEIRFPYPKLTSWDSGDT